MAPKESLVEVLPSQISTPGDLSRLIRELDNLDKYLNQAALRNPGEVSNLPQTSRTLEELASMNSFNLLKPDNRKIFIALLDEIKKNAPIIHFGFATPPSLTFMTKLASWLRSNIHPQLLIKVGLEPSIVGGCIVRTTNKQFDFTLRKHFILKHNLLLESLTGLKEPSRP